MAKGTDAEIELRIATIYEMIVKGCSRAYILRYSADNWNIEERTVDSYLSKVRDLIKETYGDEYKESILNNHLAQLEDLYIKNYTIEDFRECRNIIESKNKMLGLNAAEKIQTEHSGEIKSSNLSNMSTDELIKRAGLIKKING